MAWLNSDDKYHRDAFFKVAYLFDSFPGVVLDIQGYKHYLSFKDDLKDSPKLMAATEEAFQYLLKMSSANLTEKESRDKLLVEVNMKADHLEALHSSLSWRITKPLRWLGEVVKQLRDL